MNPEQAHQRTKDNGIQRAAEPGVSEVFDEIVRPFNITRIIPCNGKPDVEQQQAEKQRQTEACKKDLIQPGRKVGFSFFEKSLRLYTGFL